MYLFRIRNDLWWIFVIEKRIQFVKTVQVPILIILKQKKFQFFLNGAKKVKKNLKFSMLNFLRSSFLRLDWTRNNFLVVSWPFSAKKTPLGDPIDLQKNSHAHHWIRLIKTLHLSTHMTIFEVIIFLIKKVAKLIETQKFCQNRLNHLILH